MKKYMELEASEEEFLEWYKKQDLPTYEKPSLTIDNVILTFDNEDEKVKILLIKRKQNPSRNKYALPGGFVNATETVEEAAIRETVEETSVVVNNNQQKQFSVFSNPGRDPRGWVVTAAFITMIASEQLNKEEAGDDALSVEWCTIEKIYPSLIITNKEKEVINEYAFDHKLIIEKAFENISKNIYKENEALLLLDKDKLIMSNIAKIYSLFEDEEYTNKEYSNLYRKLYNKNLIKVKEPIEKIKIKKRKPSKLMELGGM